MPGLPGGSVQHPPAGGEGDDEVARDRRADEHRQHEGRPEHHLERVEGRKKTATGSRGGHRFTHHGLEPGGVRSHR